MTYIGYIFTSITISYLLFKNYRKITSKLDLIDSKNKNYALNSTPTGSGIIFLVIFLIGNFFFLFDSHSFLDLLPNRYYLFILSISVLTIISFFDDIKSLDPILRLILQIFFIYLSITTLKINSLPFPEKLAILITVIIWIYIINISNFIDGSDGFLILTFLFYCLAIIIFSFFFKIEIFSKFIALICIPFVIIFLIFNKPPAKLFMGDAGSIFIGFISGFFFLELIIAEKWYLAISLMSYKIIDCTYCLIKKLKKGIMPWVGLYDYFFLIPIIKNKINHYNVFFLKIIFLILNLIILFIQEYYDFKNLFLLSIFLSISLCIVFKDLEGKFLFLKIKK